MSILADTAFVQSPATTYIEDVFSTYLYTGTGAAQTITTGIDADLVWIKGRSNAVGHALFDTTRGANARLKTDGTTATSSALTDLLTAFSSTGFTLGADDTAFVVNENAYTYTAWSFVEANKFFKVAQVTVSGGADTTVDLSSLGTVGMVAVKRTDSTSDWFVFHRSCTSGKLLYLNTTAAETTDGSITLSGTTLALEGGVIADGTYIVYAWAHDTASTGLIQCGTFTLAGSGAASVTVGWEPQYLLYKRKDSTGDWTVADTMRGYAQEQYALLYPNTSGAEAAAAGHYLWPTAVGFDFVNLTNGDYIYLAIRRGPMKLPTAGTQVYNAIARTGTGAAATVTGVGFPPDLVATKCRNQTQGSGWFDRLRGATKGLMSSATSAEASETDSLIGFDSMDGFRLGVDAGYADTNYNTWTYINHCFRRYPGVFDEVCYTGNDTARTISHNLTIAPQLVIVKARSTAYAFKVSDPSSGNGFTNALDMSTIGPRDPYTGYWNDTAPTATVFSVGSGPTTNLNGTTFVAYLFATLAGISKVGSYTGNGSALTLNMGFAAGARFFMCKRTDSTGDWFVWDSTRGIIAGNDPHLSLNTTAAEVTNDDSVDPDNNGIIVNELAATHINVNNATYIYLAFA